MRNGTPDGTVCSDLLDACALVKKNKSEPISATSPTNSDGFITEHSYASCSTVERQSFSRLLESSNLGRKSAPSNFYSSPALHLNVSGDVVNLQLPRTISPVSHEVQCLVHDLIDTACCRGRPEQNEKAEEDNSVDNKLEAEDAASLCDTTGQGALMGARDKFHNNIRELEKKPQDLRTVLKKVMAGNYTAVVSFKKI